MIGSLDVQLDVVDLVVLVLAGAAAGGHVASRIWRNRSVKSNRRRG